jgi:hypothetical protein
MQNCLMTEERVIGGGLTTGIKEPYISNPFSEPAPPLTSAEACSYNLFFLISFGDSSLRKAKELARIKSIGFADRVVVHYNLTFIFISVSCTRVTGS